MAKRSSLTTADWERLSSSVVSALMPSNGSRAVKVTTHFAFYRAISSGSSPLFSLAIISR